jgi:hypothetical protein
MLTYTNVGGNNRETMDKIEIRRECERLFRCATLQDSSDLLNVFLNFFIQVIDIHHYEKVNSDADRDAKMIHQMMFTKTAHIKRLIEGISVESESGLKLNSIIDPTVLAVLIRNVYETVGMFHLIYRRTKNDDEKTIIYDLWVHAGLKFRQRFENVITTDENREKFENEQNQIKELEDEIKNTKLFQELNEKNQNKILTKLKEKDFKIWFNNNNVEFLSWQEITKVMGLKNDLFDNIYTYFSLYSHPSNVAVFQFSDMFDKGDKVFQRLTNHNLTYLTVLLSIYTADFINLFPEVNVTYNKQSIGDQVVMNFHNMTMRGDDYSINEIWKELQ